MTSKRLRRTRKLDHKSITFLRKKAWKLQSEVIRREEKGVCFTCGKKDNWKNQNAGHFIHQDSLDLERRNIHCQCPRCNVWLRGNLVVYAINMEKKYGPGIIQELKHWGDKVKIWKVKELEELIIKLEEQLKTALNGQ